MGYVPVNVKSLGVFPSQDRDYISGKETLHQQRHRMGIPPIQEALKLSGLKNMEVYVIQRRTKVFHHIFRRPILLNASRRKQLDLTNSGYKGW